MKRFNHVAVCQHASISKWLGMEGAANMRGLLGHLEQEWADVRWIAYGLATARHETGADFRCRTEFATKADPEFLRYERPPFTAWLGNNQPGDGKRFRGRCFVQLTGRRNYQRMGQLIGVDLVSNPELALVPANAYRIMSLGMARGIFTGLSLSRFITGTVCDYAGARRVVNGNDRAELIAGYAREFETALVAAQIN